MIDDIGQQLGNYHLIQLLGQGEFARVYVGEHVHNHMQVAIKVFPPLIGNAIEQFSSQVDIASHLDHPHIVHILEFGIEKEIPFIVMEYAPFGTLRQLHPKGTQLPLTTIVSYVKQVADALQYVHEQHLIHRDVKPHNMLLGYNRQVLLSDFGIATLAQSMGHRRQNSEEFEGTILYAAPEQIRGQACIASDQYALGVVVYEWLSGIWPFQGSVSEIASQHALTLPPPLSAQIPMVLPAVEQVIRKALAKDPIQRFENVQAFANALEQASHIELSHPGNGYTITPIPSPLPEETIFTEQTNIGRQSSSLLCIYQGHRKYICMLAWSPDGQSIASSSLDETVQLWDAATGHERRTYRTHSLQEIALAWSPNGAALASTCGLLSEAVEIWDITTGKNAVSEMAAYTEHSDTVHAIAWSPNGETIATASSDHAVYIWHPKTMQLLYAYHGHTQGVRSVAWSPDGTRIASAGDDRILQVWYATSGRDIQFCYGHLDTINAVAWSPDGIHVASASDDQTICIWDPNTGYKAMTYQAHSSGVTALAWSPDSTRIASASRDKTVHIWEAATGHHLFTYDGHTDWVITLAWSPDGTRIASGSWDKTVHVWQAPATRLIPIIAAASDSATFSTSWEPE